MLTLPPTNDWQITPTLAHPGQPGSAAVRKWTVPGGVTRVRVTGTWTRGAGGIDSDVILLYNTTIRFRRIALLPSATATISQIFDVAAGNVLEFRVAAGTSGDVTSDSTALHALIYSTTANTNLADIA